MEPEIRATEYFCPTCPETLLLYAERSQTVVVKRVGDS